MAADGACRAIMQINAPLWRWRHEMALEGELASEGKKIEEEEK